MIGSYVPTTIFCIDFCARSPDACRQPCLISMEYLNAQFRTVKEIILFVTIQRLDQPQIENILDPETLHPQIPTPQILKSCGWVADLAATTQFALSLNTPLSQNVVSIRGLGFRVTFKKRVFCTRDFTHEDGAWLIVRKQPPTLGADRETQSKDPQSLTR